jgi:prefoldin subunit 5
MEHTGDVMAELTGATAAIVLRREGVLIERLEVSDREVAGYLEAFPEPERPQRLVHAIRVGVFCLQHAVAAQNTEFVRRQVEQLLGEVDRKTREIVPAVRDSLIAKLGTGPGQALAPVAEVARAAETAISKRLDEVHRRLDPKSSDSDLGQALAEVRALLDPERKGSIQDVLGAVVRDMVGQDGPLVAQVKKQVSEAVQPLAGEIDKLRTLLTGQQAVEAALRDTTVKGGTYEEEVVELLQRVFGRNRITVEHVGGDNQPGDVVLTFLPEGPTGQPLKIVVEARDREHGFGHKRVSQDLEEAMRHRSAQGAVYVARTPAGLAAEIGDWGEGRVTSGPYIATVHDYLPVAVRWVAVQVRHEAAQASKAAMDIGAVEPQVNRVRTALKRLTTMRTQLTSGKTVLDKIGAEVDSLEAEIKDALRQIEDALRLGSRAGEPASE